MARKIINTTIEILLIAILLPIAITQFTSVSTTGWDTTLQTVWRLIPLLAVLGIGIGFALKIRGR